MNEYDKKLKEVDDKIREFMHKNGLILSDEVVQKSLIEQQEYYAEVRRKENEINIVNDNEVLYYSRLTRRKLK